MPAVEPVPVKAGLEEYCLSLVLAHPSALAAANNLLEQQGVIGLTVNDFKWGENREIFKSVQLWTASEELKIEMLVEMVGEVRFGRHFYIPNRERIGDADWPNGIDVLGQVTPGGSYQAHRGPGIEGDRVR